MAASNYRPLSRFFDIFEANQIMVCLFDDLEGDAAGFYRQIFRFLQVDDGFEANTGERYNQSGRAKNSTLESLLRGTYDARRALKRHLPSALALPLARKYHSSAARNYERDGGLTSGLKQELTDRHFRSDILELQTLIGRDLSHWLR